MPEQGIRKNKTVLITGGLGFIGGHFARLMLGEGFNVINIDKITYASNIKLGEYFSKQFPTQYRFIKKDINDLTELPYSDYIVHFAAESHVDNSINASGVFIKSNILGTHNLLNLLIKGRTHNLLHDWKFKTPNFIYISTDEVFGDIKEGHFKEDDRHNPSNPYSATKSAAEMLVKSFGRTYGLPYIITRTTNNYGERQHPEKLVSFCLTQINKGAKIRIHGSGEQVRNWIYVRDNCRAIYDVMLRGETGETYHISSPEEYSVSHVARTVLALHDKPFNDNTVEFIQDRSGQDMRYALDSSKIREKLNWAPQYTFNDAIKKIAASYNDERQLFS
ncbi:MAG: GDP-mannose 4,6-dehydratase [Patescibacteria group bacterium]